MTKAPSAVFASFPDTRHYQPEHAVQGGMGTVFFCVDNRNQQNVVLKSIRADKQDRQSPRIRFLQEVVDWIYLEDHPNIVKAHRVERLGNPALPYLVLERVIDARNNDDVSLSAALKRRKGHPFGFQKSLKIIWQISRGMAYASGKIEGLAHRDIKPGNILLNVEGDALLTDFGLASVWEADLDQSKIKDIKLDEEFEEWKPAGTAPYIAPELWQPGVTADCRSDIYALGLTFYELLTAMRGVHGATREALKAAHTSGNLNPIPDGVPAGLAAVMRKCVAFKPEDRFQTWLEVSEALSQCYEDITGNPLISEEVNMTKSNSELNDSYLVIANAYFDLGFVHYATQYLAGIEDKILKQNNKTTVKEFYRTQALVLSANQLHEKSLHALDKGIELAKGDGANTEIELLSIRGEQLANLGKHGEALECHFQATQLAKQSDDTVLQIMTLGNLGNAYAKSGQFERAVEQYAGQLSIAEIKNDTVAHVSCLTNLGFAFDR